MLWKNRLCRAFCDSAERPSVGRAEVGAWGMRVGNWLRALLHEKSNGRVAQGDYSRRIKFDRKARQYEACCCRWHVIVRTFLSSEVQTAVRVYVQDCALFLGVTQQLLAVFLCLALYIYQGPGLELWVGVGVFSAVFACVNLFFLGIRLRHTGLFWPHYVCLIGSVTSAGYFCYGRLEALLGEAGGGCRGVVGRLVLATLYLGFIGASYASIYAAMRVRRFLLDWADFDAAFLRPEDRELSKPLSIERSASQPSLLVIHF